MSERVSDERLRQIAETSYCLEEEKRGMARELIERRAAERWIPVQERMPADRKAVLVRCPERQNTYCATWEAPHWRVFGSFGCHVEEDVHFWRPLPAPPAQQPVQPEEDQ